MTASPKHNPTDALLLFGTIANLIEHDLDQIEQDYGVTLNRGRAVTSLADDAYYPQIEQAIRTEAAQMAPHYEIFYSLENTIRGLIEDSLEAADGEDWWASGRVPPRIRDDAEGRRKREIDTGNTPRSTSPLDFTTFGELSEVIKDNWDVFGSLFTSPKAVEKVMSTLNTLRGPIAHCSPLAEDEIVRLRLTVRDWFRLME